MLRPSIKIEVQFVTAPRKANGNKLFSALTLSWYQWGSLVHPSQCSWKRKAPSVKSVSLRACVCVCELGLKCGVTHGGVQLVLHGRQCPVALLYFHTVCRSPLTPLGHRSTQYSPSWKFRHSVQCWAPWDANRAIFNNVYFFNLT